MSCFMMFFARCFLILNMHRGLLENIVHFVLLLHASSLTFFLGFATTMNQNLKNSSLHFERFWGYFWKRTTTHRKSATPKTNAETRTFGETKH